MTQVCSLDGVTVIQARGERWLHIDSLPPGIDPDHDIVPVAYEDRKTRVEQRFGLKGAAEDMLLHHGTLHPLEGCEWADRLRAALKMS